MISGERLDNGTSILRTRQAYDEVNRPVYQAWQVGGTLYEEGYTYNSTQNGSLNTHHTATGQTLTMQYDGLRRLSGITGGVYGKTYTYRDISNDRTTTQIASVVYDLPTDQSYGYTYDNMGNIATYTDANGTVTYTYDAQGQLLSATDGTTTYSYTYDTVGNILTANGHTYSYGNADWKDLLTAYDGEAITYDAIGNPLSYYNGTRWTFTWEDGRQLATATDGTTNVSYTYDSDGIRTSKTVNGVKHTYVYASGKLLRETYGDTIIDFFYSTSGQPYALSHNGTTYYYITNVQGDVMSIVDGLGAVVVSYKYDPYGNILSTTGTLADTLGQINPLRYRGYVYDQETGLYYLQSRYYNAKMGRFLNADAFASTGQGILGNNMFAYCLNNPIMNTDALGTSAQYAQIVDTVDEICANLLHALRNAEDITQKLNHAMINNAEELYTYNRIYGRLAATYYFVKMVKPGGEWDFKSQKEWGLKSGKFYLYNGKLLAYDDIGNIHYGFVGSVLFAEDVLLEAGGYVQLYTKTSSLSYWNSNWDDPRDQKAIKFGCQLWREGFE